MNQDEHKIVVRRMAGLIAAASVRENIILALQAQRGWLPVSYTHLTLPTTPYV